MHQIRIAANIALAGLLIVAGLHLLSIDAYALRGLLFTGLSRYLLSASLLLMAGFSGAVAWGWVRGTIAKPPPSLVFFDPTFVDPVYKGALVVKYWYLVAPALVLLVAAVVLADAGHGRAQLHLSATLALWAPPFSGA